MTEAPRQSPVKTGRLSQKSIKIAKDKFDCVTCVVTDNARNVDKRRDGLEEDDSSLVVYGCSVHMLNLLGHDITPIICNEACRGDPEVYPES